MRAGSGVERGEADDDVPKCAGLVCASALGSMADGSRIGGASFVSVSMGRSRTRYPAHSVSFVSRRKGAPLFVAATV